MVNLSWKHFPNLRPPLYKRSHFIFNYRHSLAEREFENVSCECDANKANPLVISGGNLKSKDKFGKLNAQQLFNFLLD